MSLHTGTMQAMHTLTLAVNPLTWFNEYWRDIWVRGPAASDDGRSVDGLGMWLWWFCVLWFVFLMTLMFYFVARYRRKPGQIAQRSATHNTPLEIAWTIIPTLFLVWIFFKGFGTYMHQVVAPGDAIEMSVTGSKWNWQLDYPNGSQTNQTTTIGARPIPVFYFPGGRAIKLKMHSVDVNHSFFVPDFRIKEDVMPNRYTTEWFKAGLPDGSHHHPKSLADVVAAKETAKSKGLRYTGPEYIKGLEDVPYEDHWIFCAEYCGDEHSEMAAIMRVIPEDAFNGAWMESIGLATKPLVEVGQTIWRTRGCNQCHSIDGSKNTGPTWKNMYGHAVSFTDGNSLSDEDMTGPKFDEYVRESILLPGKKIVLGFGPQMPVQTLKDREIEGVIAYLKTISDKAPAPVAAPAEKPADGKPAESKPDTKPDTKPETKPTTEPKK